MSKSVGHQLSLSLLGSSSLRSGESLVHLSRRKSIALLAYLALEPGEHARDTLAAMLWPECAQSSARANLRSSLLDIAVNFSSELIACDRDHARFVSGIVFVDAVKLLEAAGECRSHGLESACDCCAPLLIEAAALGKGSFMQGFSLTGCPEFDNWQSTMANRISEAEISVVQRLTYWYSEIKKTEKAIDAAHRWIELDPYDEQARLCLFRILAAQGKKAAAEESFRVWEAFVAKELGASPDLAFHILKKEFSYSKNVATLVLIGREKDESMLRTRLGARFKRIHTITGPGGVGKTCLAKAIAASPGSGFPDGSVFVDLSAIRDPALVLSELAAALGLGRRSTEGESLFSRVATTLCHKRMLVVLDNLEQVRDASIEIKRLEYLCSDIVFLGTSRIALGLESEDEFPLAPLAVPKIPEDCKIEDGEHYPALLLFMERARSARSSILFTELEIPKAARICARLEGLPLALELAASRLVAFSLEELDLRIQKSTKVVSGMETIRPERHRSLHAAIAWSWDLLEKGERHFLQQLSVFSGGFDHETAGLVCDPAGNGGLSEFLESLVEWRLVARTETAGRSRFYLPEVIREFAYERLEMSGGAAKARNRHADYFLSKARSLALLLHGTRQRQALEQLEEEYANMKAAMEWLGACGRIEDQLSLIESLEWFWYRSGRYGEGRAAFEAALAHPDAINYPVLMGRSFRAQAWLALLHGDWMGAIRAYEQSVSLLRQSGDDEGLARALSELGLAERWLGRHSEGFAHCREGLAISRASGDPARIAAALIWLYANTGGKKVDDTHLAGLEEILLIARHVEDPWLEAHAFQGLGDYYRENGGVETAISCYKESLNVFEEVGEELMKAWSLEGLGMAEIKAGRYEDALERLRASCAIFYKLGDRGDVAYLIGEIGIAYLSKGEEDMGDLLLGCACGILGGMTTSYSYSAHCADSGKKPNAVPSSLSPHFAAAKDRGNKKWIEGLYLNYESAVKAAIL